MYKFIYHLLVTPNCSKFYLSSEACSQLSTDLIKIMEHRLSAIELRSAYLENRINQVCPLHPIEIHFSDGHLTSNWFPTIIRGIGWPLLDYACVLNGALNCWSKTDLVSMNCFFCHCLWKQIAMPATSW